MCVMIIRENEEVQYNPNIPLESQIQDSKEIIVNYTPNDSSIGKFIDEMENLIKHGMSGMFKMKVNHNDNIAGLKANKQIKKAKCDLRLNELIKLLVLSQNVIDKKLTDLMDECKLNVR